MLLAFIFLQEKINLWGNYWYCSNNNRYFYDDRKKGHKRRAEREKEIVGCYMQSDPLYLQVISILGKIGISGVESNLGTAIRTVSY